MKPCQNCSRRAWRTARLEEVKGGDPGRRGIGLVEIPFVEPEAEVCQADLPGVLVESGHRLTAPCLKARLPLINVIDVMKPENA